MSGVVLTDRHEGPDHPLATERFRVTMGDTDAARVIFFGAPLRWSERLVSTWLADSGHPTSEAIRSGYGLPAVHTEIDYSAPLRLDDRIDAALWAERVSERSITFRSSFTSVGQSQPAAVVRTTQVYVVVDGDSVRAVAMPRELRAALNGGRPAVGRSSG